MKRKSGILLHISSLPGPEGIGTLGEEAYTFADFLAKSGCHVWQVLPMGPTGFGESPYQSPSMYAGNTLYISLASLRKSHLVTYTDDEYEAAGSEDQVDFPSVRLVHEKLLRRCYSESAGKLQPDISAFRKRSPWVEDYALFLSLKHHFGDGIWTAWPEKDVRQRKPAALRRYREELKDEVEYHIFCQYLFDLQWSALKKYCNQKGILLFGDMPIYVAEDSADTWVNPMVFQLDRNRIPKRVAGVPPDYFSEDGQRWGNPLYNWTYLRLTGYRWWLSRMRHMLTMYDIVRVDHFIAFANYYSIPYQEKTARIGKWVLSPGKSFFRKLLRELPHAEIVAEDLGEVTPRVKELLRYTGFPGMFVLLFGFGGSPEENHHFPSHWTENAVGYTGTHDNDTVLGYLERAEQQELASARQALGFTDIKDGPEAFIRCVLSSPCRIAVVPMQDYLHLDNRARMNLPGSIGGNWMWRMTTSDLTDTLASHIAQYNKQYGRN